jgi:hypothetical protein
MHPPTQPLAQRTVLERGQVALLIEQTQIPGSPSATMMNRRPTSA